MRQESLFPDLVDRPRYGGFVSMGAAALAAEREHRAWWAAWEREHPPPRECICGEPGGTLWLTFLDERGGPRPYHPECAPRPAQPLVTPGALITASLRAAIDKPFGVIFPT